MRLYAGRAQRRHVAVGQVETADAVVQEVDTHALLGLCDQCVFEHFAERVVAHDEELHDHVMASPFDRFEDGLEGCRAVHERAYGIARQERHAPQACQRMHEPRAKFLGGQPCGGSLRIPYLRMRARAQQFVFDAAGVRVTLKLAAAEKQIRHQCQIRHGNQRHRPRDRALRRTGVQNRVARRDQSEDMGEGD